MFAPRRMSLAEQLIPDYCRPDIVVDDADRVLKERANVQAGNDSVTRIEPDGDYPLTSSLSSSSVGSDVVRPSLPNGRPNPRCAPN